jgi:SAM-dependent methyltransferase
MDYVGHLGRPDLSDDDAARAFFARIDREFHRAAWFAHAPGDPLFAGLIDYADWRGRRVLEVGCGLGAIAGELARQGARVTALDLTWTGAAAASKRFCLDRTHATAVQADAETLPFADRSFDIVWSWGAIHHTTMPTRAIAEIHRVLRPGGEIRMMVYNRHSFYNWLTIVLRHGIIGLELRRYSVQELWNRYSDARSIGGCPRVGYFTAAGVRALLVQFDVVELRAFEQKSAVTRFAPTSWRPALEPLIPDALMHALFSRFGLLLYCRALRRN